jgi:hypothetical protein
MPWNKDFSSSKKNYPDTDATYSDEEQKRLAELDDENDHDNEDTERHRKNEGDVFWNEEAGILFKWGMFWTNKLLNEYDPEYGKLVLDENGDYSVVKML